MTPTRSNPVADVHALVARVLRRAWLGTIGAIALETSVGALAGLSAVLALGTDRAGWSVALLPTLGACAYAVWRRRARWPREFDAARTADRTLDTRDVFTTALHIDRTGSTSRFATIIVEQAAETARANVASAAWPWRAPKTWRVAVVLALITMTLTIVRYGVLHTLSLRAPVVALRWDPFSGRVRAESGERRTKTPEQMRLEQFGLDQQTDLTDWNPPPGALKNYEIASKSTAGQPTDARSNDASDAGMERNSGDNSTQEIPKNADAAKSGDTKAAAREATPKEASKMAEANQREGLVDKVRNALSSMLDRLKNQPSGESKQQSASNGSPQNKQNKNGQTNQGSEQRAESKSEQSSQQSESQQGGQNSPNETSASNNTPQNRSGAGRQEGNKDVAQAEEERALGKLEELVGKRSLNLRGEMSLEVENTSNPRLATPLVQSGARHADAGGELSRDEVPVRHQQFVRRYYEQLRKQADSLPAPRKPAQ